MRVGDIFRSGNLKILGSSPGPAGLKPSRVTPMICFCLDTLKLCSFASGVMKLDCVESSGKVSMYLANDPSAHPYRHKPRPCCRKD